MDENRNVLLELVKERFGSEEFQKQVVEVMRDQMVVTSEKVEGKQEWEHTFAFPAGGQVKDEEAPPLYVWKIQYVAEKFPTATRQECQKIIELADDAAALNEGSFSGIVDRLHAAIQADLNRSMLEGEQPQETGSAVMDPEPRPLDLPYRQRCDAQKKEPRKMTNREKRRDRHAKRAARRR